MTRSTVCHKVCIPWSHADSESGEDQQSVEALINEPEELKTSRDLTSVKKPR